MRIADLGLERERLADTLRAYDEALTVNTDWLTLINLPAAIIVPGSPWLNTGDDMSFGHVQLTVDCVAVVSLAATGSLPALESVVANIMQAGLEGDWDVTIVEVPGTVTVNSTKALATTVTLTKHIRLKAER